MKEKLLLKIRAPFGSPSVVDSLFIDTVGTLPLKTTLFEGDRIIIEHREGYLSVSIQEKQ